MHNADSILPALISTQNVTWYYWGQNRFGNLLPALTSWIGDVDLNLKAQILLRAFCAALGPVFFILVLRPKARLIPVYCATIAAMIFLERDLLAHWYWTDAQPYGTSLALLLPPLLVASHSWRFNTRSASIAIMVLFLLMVALWVNLSAVLFALPLFLGLAIVERSGQFLVLAVLLALAYELDSAHAAHVGRNFAYAAFAAIVDRYAESGQQFGGRNPRFANVVACCRGDFGQLDFTGTKDCTNCLTDACSVGVRISGHR